MYHIFIFLLIIVILPLSYYFYKSYYKKLPTKYIAYEGDCSGLVNRKMQLELLLSLSSIYNRTLIIPPPHNWPHITQKSNITDYFDIQLLKKKYDIIFFTEYEPTKNMNYNEYIKFMEKNGKFSGLKTINPEKNNYMECKHIYEQNNKEDFWFFPACRDNMTIRIIGNYDAYFKNYPYINTLRKDLTKFIKFKKKFFDLTWKTLNNNGITKKDKYHAIHVRRSDFKHYRPELTRVTSIQSIINYIRENIPKNEKILIISDEKNPNFFEPVQKNFNIIRLKYLDNIPKKYIRIIDILASVNAYKFIGTPLSTFSYLIIILRNQSKKNIVKKPLFLDKNFDVVVRNNNWKAAAGWNQIHPSKINS